MNDSRRMSPRIVAATWRISVASKLSEISSGPGGRRGGGVALHENAGARIRRGPCRTPRAAGWRRQVRDWARGVAGVVVTAGGVSLSGAPGNARASGDRPAARRARSQPTDSGDHGDRGKTGTEEGRHFSLLGGDPRPAAAGRGGGHRGGGVAGAAAGAPAGAAGIPAAGAPGLRRRRSGRRPGRARRRGRPEPLPARAERPAGRGSSGHAGRHLDVQGEFFGFLAHACSTTRRGSTTSTVMPFTCVPFFTLCVLPRGDLLAGRRRPPPA